MPFQFQRRLNLTNGLGINLSKSGASLSCRFKYGSVSSKGFSLRTGIPGLSYRFRARKGSDLNAIFGLLMLIPIIIRMTIFLAGVCFKLAVFMYWLFLVVPIKLLNWLILTTYDYYLFIKSKNA